METAGPLFHQTGIKGIPMDQTVRDLSTGAWPEGLTRVPYWVYKDQEVARDEQTRVFDRFVSRSQGSRHRGAGLGLPIVKHLVELHGGSIALTSEPGKGTRVTARFPADMKALQTGKAA